MLEGARVVESSIAEAFVALGDTPIIKYLVRVPGMDPDILQVRVRRPWVSWCRSRAGLWASR